MQTFKGGSGGGGGRGCTTTKVFLLQGRGFHIENREIKTLITNKHCNYSRDSMPVFNGIKLARKDYRVILFSCKITSSLTDTFTLKAECCPAISIESIPDLLQIKNLHSFLEGDGGK